MDQTQFDSAARLAALNLIRQEKLACVRALSDRVMDLGQRRQRALGRIERLELDGIGHRDKTTSDEIARLHAEVAAIVDEQQRCAEQRDAAGAQSQAAGRVYDAALKFAREHGLPLPIETDDGSRAVVGTGQGVIR